MLKRKYINKYGHIGTLLVPSLIRNANTDRVRDIQKLWLINHNCKVWRVFRGEMDLVYFLTVSILVKFTILIDVNGDCLLSTEVLQPQLSTTFVSSFWADQIRKI